MSNHKKTRLLIIGMGKPEEARRQTKMKATQALKHIKETLIEGLDSAKLSEEIEQEAEYFVEQETGCKICTCSYKDADEKDIEQEEYEIYQESLYEYSWHSDREEQDISDESVKEFLEDFRVMKGVNSGNLADEDGMHVVILKDKEGNLYYASTEGISDEIPGASRDDDTYLVNDNCVYEEIGDYEEWTQSGETIIAIVSERYPHRWYAVWTQNHGDFKTEIFAIVDNVPESTKKKEVEKVVEKGLGHVPGEFGVAWGNCFVISDTEANEKVRHSVSEDCVEIDFNTV